MPGMRNVHSSFRALARISVMRGLFDFKRAGSFTVRRAASGLIRIALRFMGVILAGMGERFMNG